MTRIVSISSPAGIIIAGDSLGTLAAVIESDKGQQKVFPLFGRYGIGVYGFGEVDSTRGSIPVYDFLHEYEQTFVIQEVPTLFETAKAVAERLFNQRWNSLSVYKGVYSADDWREYFGGLYQGLHLVGYENGVPSVYHVRIKITPQLMLMDEPCFPTNDEELFEHRVEDFYLVNGEDRSPVPHFASLDDMRINVISFIRSEANKDTTVGGEIKVGLITPVDGFAWAQGGVIEKRS